MPQIALAAGLGLMAFAGLSNGAVWMEFYQYFRASKFVSVYILELAWPFYLTCRVGLVHVINCVHGLALSRDSMFGF